MADVAAQAIAQGLRAHDEVRRSTQLPLFYGFDKENTISANTLLDRVDAAAAVANWDNAQKCRQLFLILRKEALLWWESLRHVDGLDRNTNWDQVKQRFLKSYAPKFTARTNCLNLLKLSQAPGERVQTYFLRLDETFKRMSENRPAAILNVRVAPLAGAAQDDARDLLLKQEGLKDQEKFFLTQMFIAGLRENLRQKVMEEAPDNLMDLVDLAIEKETIFSSETKPETIPIFSIKENDEKEETKNELEGDEIEMINAIRKAKNQPLLKKGGYTGPMGPCRYCKINGHSQKFCRKRIKDKAPCVDQNGQPYKVSSLGGQTDQQQQQQQQQHYEDYQRISAIGANPLNY